MGWLIIIFFHSAYEGVCFFLMNVLIINSRQYLYSIVSSLPAVASQTQHIILMMVYVAAGIIGTTIITCVIICLITKLCRRKRKHPTNTPSSPEHRSPCASTSPPSNPPNVYRYITLQTNEEATGNAVVMPTAPPITSSDETPCEQTVILRDQDFRPASLPPSYEEVIKQMSVSS